MLTGFVRRGARYELIDPDDRSVLVFQPHQQPEFCHKGNKLNVLDGVDLELTVEQVFA